MKTITILIFGISAILFGVPPKTGLVYEKDSNPKKILFRWKRIEKESGSVKTVESQFNYPDGKSAVKESATFENNKLKNYQIDHLQTKEKGSVTVRGGKIFFEYTKNGETEKNEEDYVDNFVVATTLVDYLAAHKETLLKGESVDVRYAVLDRRETVGFKFSKEEESKKDGLQTMLVKMRAKSIFIAAIVDPLYFTLSIPDMNLRELVGRTLPKLSVDGKWKDLDADIVYSY